MTFILIVNCQRLFGRYIVSKCFHFNVDSKINAIFILTIIIYFSKVFILYDNNYYWNTQQSKDFNNNKCSLDILCFRKVLNTSIQLNFLYFRQSSTL